MPTFDSFEACAKFMRESEPHIVKALKNALGTAADAVKQTAKNKMGVYQEGIGGFNKWEQLAKVTQEDRAERGFAANEPLLVTGALRDSLHYRVQNLTARIGSTSDIMVYQELGTNKIPPRPVLGPALLENKEVIQKAVGKAFLSGVFNTATSAHPDAPKPSGYQGSTD